MHLLPAPLPLFLYVICFVIFRWFLYRRDHSARSDSTGQSIWVESDRKSDHSASGAVITQLNLTEIDKKN